MRAYAQHPIGYASLKETSQTGEIKFQDLDREILKKKAANFYVEQPCTMQFDILVAPSGAVKYVRSQRVGQDKYQMRLACTSALYAYEFSPVDETVGEVWIKAEVEIKEE